MKLQKDITEHISVTNNYEFQCEMTDIICSEAQKYQTVVHQNITVPELPVCMGTKAQINILIDKNIKEYYIIEKYVDSLKTSFPEKNRQ